MIESIKRAKKSILYKWKYGFKHRLKYCFGITNAIKRVVNYVWIKVPSSVKISIGILGLFAIIVLFVTYVTRSYKNGFFKGILIESYGMLFDILVISIILLWLNEARQKKLEIKRYQEQIDDFRDWKSDEAKYRIVGAVKRLNKLGEQKIDLSLCYLKEADLHEAELNGSTIHDANLQGANLSGANLQGSNLNRANLQNAHLFNANLKQARLSGVNMREADLHKANLKGAVISEAHSYFDISLLYPDLRGAKLIDTDFQDADLFLANLEGAIVGELYRHMRGDSFEGANFQGADLRDTNLQNIKIIETSISGENPEGPDRAEAIDLIIDMLSKAKSLNGAKLDTDIQSGLEEEHPLVFTPLTEDWEEDEEDYDDEDYEDEE